MSQSFLGLEKVEISFGDPTNNVVCVCWGGGACSDQGNAICELPCWSLDSPLESVLEPSAFLVVLWNLTMK